MSLTTDQNKRIAGAMGIYREIPLSKGQIAIVDEDDYEKVNEFKWYASKKNTASTYYAVLTKKHKRQRTHDTILMHRFIMGLEIGDPRIIDHINRNGLDNRKENLRIADRSLNGYNCKLPKDNTSGYRGVSWHKHMQKWRAVATMNKKQVSFGYHRELLDAVMAFDEGVKKIRGASAITNL